MKTFLTFTSGNFGEASSASSEAFFCRYMFLKDFNVPVDEAMTLASEHARRVFDKHYSVNCYGFQPRGVELTEQKSLFNRLMDLL